MICSTAFQAVDSWFVAAAELIDFDAHLPGHLDKEIGEVGVVLLVVGDVLAVFEAAAGEDEGEVAPAVAAGVAEVGAHENHGVVQQGALAAGFGGVGEFFGEVLEGETLETAVGIDTIGTKSATFDNRIYRTDGTLVFRSLWKSALMDLDTRRAVAVPEDLRNTLSQLKLPAL